MSEHAQERVAGLWQKCPKGISQPCEEESALVRN